MIQKGLRKMTKNSDSIIILCFLLKASREDYKKVGIKIRKPLKFGWDKESFSQEMRRHRILTNKLYKHLPPISDSTRKPFRIIAKLRKDKKEEKCLNQLLDYIWEIDDKFREKMYKIINK